MPQALLYSSYTPNCVASCLRSRGWGLSSVAAPGVWPSTWPHKWGIWGYVGTHRGIWGYMEVYRDIKYSLGFMVLGLMSATSSPKGAKHGTHTHTHTRLSSSGPSVVHWLQPPGVPTTCVAAVSFQSCHNAPSNNYAAEPVLLVTAAFAVPPPVADAADETVDRIAFQGNSTVVFARHDIEGATRALRLRITI